MFFQFNVDFSEWLICVFICFYSEIMSPEEIESFVKDCEERFKHRYTEKDPEYARVCKNLANGSVPPIIPYKYTWLSSF